MKRGKWQRKKHHTEKTEIAQSALELDNGEEPLSLIVFTRNQTGMACRLLSINEPSMDELLDIADLLDETAKQIRARIAERI